MLIKFYLSFLLVLTILFSACARETLSQAKGDQKVIYTNSPESYELEKRLDFELKMLKNILVIDANAENYEKVLASALSAIELTSLEDVAYIYDILLSLKKRIDSNKGYFTEDHEENEVIEYYVFWDSNKMNKPESWENSGVQIPSFED